MIFKNKYNCFKFKNHLKLLMLYLSIEFHYNKCLLKAKKFLRLCESLLIHY